MACRKRREMRDLASQRIQILLQLAEKTAPLDIELAHRYADLARRLALRARIRLSREHKARICRKCGAYLLSGKTARVRLSPGRSPHVTITCLRCGHRRRIPFKKK